jgi:argininosuccinate synthase
MDVTDLEGRTIAFLASGGLDSCTITHWLTSRGVKVVTFTADLGQPDEPDLNAVAERMQKCGAVESVIVPLAREMGEAGIEAVQAQGTYEGGYWITTPLGRQVITKGVLVHLMERRINVLAHGATGRGNDQVRFQLIANMVAPGIQVYAPWRDHYFLEQFGGRRQMIDYCESNGLPIRHTHDKPYSTDANLLGLTHEAGDLEALTTPANFVKPEMGVRATEAPDQPETVKITFVEGRPTRINGEDVQDAAELFRRANAIAGRNAVGINLHLLENRMVGTKSRGIYEAPGMQLLGSAYAYVLQAVLDHRARRIFDFASQTYAEQLYQGYSEDLGSSMVKEVVARAAELITGVVTVELYKGNVNFVALDDVPHSIYVLEHASMDDDELSGDMGDTVPYGYDHKDSEGFLRVLSLSASTIGRAGQVKGRLR